jgi:hypothetical protein
MTTIHYALEDGKVAIEAHWDIFLIKHLALL